MNEHGYTLLETLIACALAVLLLAAVTAYALGRRPYALSAAVQSVAELLGDARSIAQTSGNGATLVIAPRGSSGFVASLYPYRPLSGADLSAPAVRTLTGIVNVTSAAIFIDTSGTASMSPAWSPQSGTLGAEPPCTSAIALVFSDGYANETHTIPCGRAELQ